MNWLSQFERNFGQKSQCDRAEEFVKVLHKLHQRESENERKNPRPLFYKPPFDWS